MNWNYSIGILLLMVGLCRGEAEVENDEPETEVSLSTSIETTPISTIPTTTKDYCHCDMEIYGPDDLDGVLKSPNFPGAHCNSGMCTYKILPHPNMSVSLTVQTASFSSGTKLSFWNLLYVDGKEYTIFHSEHDDRESYYSNNFADYKEWTTAKNVGFKIAFEPKKNYDSYKGFKITFERKSDEKEDRLCGDARVMIGTEETPVVVPKPFSVVSGCTFLLSPLTEALPQQSDEMFIDIQTEAGTYVSIRTYDEDGMFYRDEYSDRNRVKLCDASKVEILVRQPLQNSETFQMPNITARLMNQSCACPEAQRTFTANVSMITVRSPGFPNLYCPGKECQTVITGEKLVKGDDVPLILISTNCTVGEDDNLKLSSVDSSRVIFRTLRTKRPPKFLRPIIVNEQDLKVTFEASSHIQTRHFEMNLTRIYVPPDCTCPVFEEKLIENKRGTFAIPIPAKCTILHCHWKFSTGYKYPPEYMYLDFNMDKPTSGDKVYIISDTVTEEYSSELLGHKRSLTSASSPIEFTFSRFNSTAEHDAVLNIFFANIESCECGETHIDVTVEEHAVQTSPNYPAMYCPNLVCRWTFYAPEGYYLEIKIDDTDIELYHDFLKIYDGNNTGAVLLDKISGRRANLSYNTSTELALLVFMTDESVSNKGFHLNVFAHPKSVEPAPGVTHWFIFLFLTTIIFAFAFGAVYFVIRKKRAQPQFQSLNNPTISYATSETGSSVSINFNSGSGLMDETCNQTENI